MSVRVIIKRPIVGDARNGSIRITTYLEGTGREVRYYAREAILNLGGIDIPGAGMAIDDDRVPAQGSTEETFHFFLGSQAIRKIEDARQGKDIHLSFGLRFLAWTENGPTVAHGSSGGAQVISAHEWLGILKDLGHPEVATFEVKVPQLVGAEDLHDAMRCLRAAETSLALGRNDEVLTQCRKAVEALSRVVVPLGETAPELAQLIDQGSRADPERPPKSARMNTIRKNLQNFLHMGPHEGYHVSRADAEFAHWCTLALAAYYSDHLTSLAAQVQG